MYVQHGMFDWHPYTSGYVNAVCVWEHELGFCGERVSLFTASLHSFYFCTSLFCSALVPGPVVCVLLVFPLCARSLSTLDFIMVLYHSPLSSHLVTFVSSCGDPSYLIILGFSQLLGGCAWVRAYGSWSEFGLLQADPEVEVAQPKKRTFKKFTFRGVDLDALLDMGNDELVELFNARARRRWAGRRHRIECPAISRCTFSFSFGVARLELPDSCNVRIARLRNCPDLAWTILPVSRTCRFQRGLKRKPMALIKKLRKAVSSKCLLLHYLFTF